MKTNRTLQAMRLDRYLVMQDARDLAWRGKFPQAAERIRTARRINWAVVHYLRNVFDEQQLQR